MIDSNYRYLPCCVPASLKNVKNDSLEMTAVAQTAQGRSFYISAAAVAENILRIRVYEKHFSEIEYSFVPPLAGCKTWDCDMDTVRVHTEAFDAQFDLNPFSFTVKNSEGQIVYEESTRDVDSVGDGFDRIPPMGFSMENDRIVGTNFCAKLHYDEHLYGLGEHFTEFDKRGQQVTMWNYDTLGCRDEHSYKNIPFYISSKGYGLLVNSGKAVQFNLGCESNASISVHVPDDEVEFYIFTGKTPKEILATYTQLTGPAVMPPEWSFGLWYSTGFKDASGESVMQDAERFREKQIPCDVMHFDCYWLREDRWCDFVWDERLYPQHVEMLHKLHQQGYKVCLWMNPYVTIRTEMYTEGEKNNYFIKNPEGKTYTADMWHGLLSYCAILDVTNPEAVAWFREKVRHVLCEGVDVLKTDFGEDIPVDSLFYNGKSGEEMRNVYSLLYNEIVFDEVQKVNREGMVWARSGSAGMQKYPVCWSGDPRSCYEGMAGTLRGGLSMAMSGVPFWSHDMGGFYGEVTEDVLIRWSQFGLFSSHSRLHGTTTRQPWAYGKRAEDILGKFIRLRYRLMPYILRNAKDCVKQGLPFLRPLWLEHPQDDHTFSIWDQYYFGDSIIVAPVFGGENTTRRVYLPQGDWEDLLTGKAYQGACWHSIVCPLDYLPVMKRLDGNVELEDAEIQHL
ncbi:MAG: alpha-xylosidase [Ruthenibacterium sp.]